MGTHTVYPGFRRCFVSLVTVDNGHSHTFTIKKWF